MSIVRPTLTYGCEVWPATVQIEQKLRSFENRVLSTICGPIFDTEVNRWRRRKNKELREITKVTPITSYIKGQRLQWFGHAMRREETNEVRAAIEYKPTGRRPRDRPKKRWIDGVQQDLERLEVTEWEERIQDRDLLESSDSGSQNSYRVVKAQKKKKLLSRKLLRVKKLGTNTIELDNSDWHSPKSLYSVARQYHRIIIYY